MRTYYEQFHRVHVPDEIVSAAVRLSERYITDRFLPDKAIDPARRELRPRPRCATSRWAEYDAAASELDSLRAQEEEMTSEEEGTEPDYEKLAALRTKMVQLEEKEKTLAPQALGANVEMEDLAQVIELWTGIPASRIQESELRKLSGLEETLNRHIIGQKEAVAAVTAAVRRSRVQISPRPPPGLVHLRGAHGRGQDRACEGAQPGAVRHAGDAHPSRHVGIHGKALRFPHHRLAARLRPATTRRGR